jgi:hypothetical protein
VVVAIGGLAIPAAAVLRLILPELSYTLHRFSAVPVLRSYGEFVTLSCMLHSQHRLPLDGQRTVFDTFLLSYALVFNSEGT